MEKKFKLSVNARPALPRSPRLRGAAGASGSSSGGSTVVRVEGGEASGSSAVGHTHPNKADLDRISTDTDGYISLTRLVETADPDTGATSAEVVTSKASAGYADKAGKAADLTDDSPVRDEFLSSIADDIAAGLITFKQGLVAAGMALFRGGAEFGTFAAGLAGGSGAAVDALGNAEVETLSVRSWMRVQELIVNRLSALEGDQLLTESDTIEAVKDLGDGSWGLWLRPKWEGYFTAQAAGNVIKGIVNTLAAGSGEYLTSWMRVNSVNAPLNYIEAQLYPDGEVPSGKNYPPCALMKIARWGNQTDATRQSCLYLSSTEGRIMHLTGVTKPIIDVTNLGATFGTVHGLVKALKEDLGLPLVDGQDYVYVRGLIARDFIRADVQGHPVAEFVDRGEWSATADYYSYARNPQTGVYEVSDVWYRGCKYRCMLTGTHVAPEWSCTDWAMVEGNPDFAVDFEDTPDIYDPDTFAVTLKIAARLHNQDVTADILPTDVVWTRYSEDAQGNPRTASDNAWAISRAGAGRQMALTMADIDATGYMPRTVRFTATVTLRDGAGAEQTAAASFEY